jgi:hypothetical protein
VKGQSGFWQRMVKDPSKAPSIQAPDERAKLGFSEPDIQDCHDQTTSREQSGWLVKFEFLKTASQAPLMASLLPWSWTFLASKAKHSPSGCHQMTSGANSLFKISMSLSGNRTRPPY